MLLHYAKGHIAMAAGLIAFCFASTGCKSKDGPSENDLAQERARAQVREAINVHGGDEPLQLLQQAQITFRIVGRMPQILGGIDMDVTIKETYIMPDYVKMEIRGRAGDEVGELSWAVAPGVIWSKQKGKELSLVRKNTVAGTNYRPFMWLENLAVADRCEWSCEADDSIVPGMKPLRCRFPGRSSDGIYGFDPKTGLVAVVVEKREVRGTIATVETHFADYRAVEKLMLPHQINLIIDGKRTCEITIMDVRFPDEIPLSVFDPPMD